MMYSEACFNSGKFKDAAKILNLLNQEIKSRVRLFTRFIRCWQKLTEKDSNHIQASKAYGDYLSLPE